jgi:hypothetical protein
MPHTEETSSEEVKEIYFEMFGYYPDNVPSNPNVPTPPNP